MAVAQAPASQEAVASGIATSLSLKDAVDWALRDNPELKAQQARWEAMQERPAQAVSLPNPMFVYSGMDMTDGGNWPNTDEKRFMVEQALPWFGKRGLREGVAKKEAEAGQWELEALTRDIVMQVKESYFDLYAVQRAIAVTQQEEKVVQGIVKVAETMYTTGARGQVDVIKAQTEVTVLKQRLLELLAQETALKAKLNSLLNRRADEPMGTAITPPESAFNGATEGLFALAAANRPEVRSAQAQVDRYELEKKLMAKESTPDFSLGVEYRDFRHASDMVMIQLGIELPVWRSKYGAAVREAEKMRTASLAARQATERQIALDVQDASFKLLTAQRTLELYKTELMPQAEARFNASEAAYRTGQTDFTDLLESQRFLLSTRIMAATAEGNLGMQSARLERAVGRELKSVASPGPSVGTQGAKYEE